MANRPGDHASEPVARPGREPGWGQGSAAEGTASSRPLAPDRRAERRRRAAELVWDWKVPNGMAAARPERRPAAKAFRDFVVGLVMAAGLYALGRPVMAVLAACISAAALTVGVILPPRFADPVIAVSGRVVHHVGQALTVTVLAVVYFTVFLFLRTWRALTGHDSLRLKASPPGQSFWIDRSSRPESSPDKPY